MALGSRFNSLGWNVFGVSRKTENHDREIRSLVWDPFSAPFPVDNALDSVKFCAVIWAQGANCNDSIRSLDLAEHENLYRANVTYILASLQRLLLENRLEPGARLCVISSIWQNITKQRKLSYTVTKSALKGLVQSLAIDLGKEGYLVNAVLPGALDTSMTRENLSDSQIEALENMTPLGTLPRMDDVCGLVYFLCSQDNTGITGQFVAADRGFSYARII